MFHPKLLQRRGSYEITNAGQIKLQNAFPARGQTSNVSKQSTYDPSRRRNSENILPDIRKSDKRDRKFSLLDGKELQQFKASRTRSMKHMQDLPPEEEGNEEDPVSLHRPLSVTPEPEIIRRKGKMVDDVEDRVLPELHHPQSYRPKYCWCLRCQLMYTMFQIGDPELEKWGNYPCFRR